MGSLQVVSCFCGFSWGLDRARHCLGSLTGAFLAPSSFTLPQRGRIPESGEVCVFWARFSQPGGQVPLLPRVSVEGTRNNYFWIVELALNRWQVLWGATFYKGGFASVDSGMPGQLIVG